MKLSTKHAVPENYGNSREKQFAKPETKYKY